MLRPKGRPWFEVDIASASFGQGISVTNMQLAMAMSVIANGGRLLEPMLVRKVTSATGALVREELPTVKREVIPAAAARMVTEMMAGVVEEGGTGREANIPGYRVAGKTATAQKADPATGKYDPDKFVGSFVGFVPAQKPRFVIAVVIDEPWVAHLGGQVAAPVFKPHRHARHLSLRRGALGRRRQAADHVPARGSDPARLRRHRQELAAGAHRPGAGAVRLADRQAGAVGQRFGRHRTAARRSARRGARGLRPDRARGHQDAGVARPHAVVEGTGTVQKQDPPAGAPILKGSTR